MTGAHVFPVRVYYEDTDAGGVVYYANYLKFAERARTEMLRGAGAESSGLVKDEQIILAARRCQADYLKPARLDDLLEVHTRLIKIGGASIELEQDVKRGLDDVACMKIRLACVSAAGHPVRLPEGLRAKLNHFLNNNDQV